MADSTPIKPTSEDAPDRTIYECTGCGTVTRDRAAQMALYKRAGALSCCPERNMVPVQPVKPAPAQDEQETFKRALLTQCVFKLNSDTMSAARWAWFHRPAQTEQRPEKDAQVAQYTIGDLTYEKVFKAAGLTNLSDMQAVLDAVETAIAQTAQQPEQSGLTGQCVIEVVSGQEGPSLYIGDGGISHRLSGNKPWAGGNTLHLFTVDIAELVREASALSARGGHHDR